VSESAYDDEVLRECLTIGAAVLAAQRIEFVLYGIVAHVRPELKGRYKTFRKLTPESFLRGEVSELRATLGQLAKAYGTEFLLSEGDLTAFVKKRNLIVHDYWRLSQARIRGGQTLANPMEFLQGFLDDCQRWESILRGLLATMKLSVAVQIGELPPVLDPDDLDYMDQYLQHVRSHLLRESQ